MELQTLHWEKLRATAKPIGAGFHSTGYLIEINSEKLVLKKFRKPNEKYIIEEISILERLSPIWPEYCKAYVFEKNTLIGFVMMYFEGQKIDQILQDERNIFHKSATARIKLIKKLAHCVKQIQDLCICHADITLENIIVKQNNIDSSDDIDVFIIDFGCAFTFELYSPIRRFNYSTGFKFLLPEEYVLFSHFDPSGINAYQFTRTAITILLLTPFSECDNISRTPEKELSNLQKLGFEKGLLNVLENGVSSSISSRNNIFNEIQNVNEFCDDAKINETISAIYSSEIDINE